MEQRLNWYKAAPEAAKLMTDLEMGVRGLVSAKLYHLVKLRASQINGCAYCIAMHTKEAREDGEDQRRLDLLQSWHETTLFDDKEEAALLWTEALTRVADTQAPDDAYERLAAAFNEKERAALTLAIVTINGWNRFQVGFRVPPVV